MNNASTLSQLYPKCVNIFPTRENLQKEHRRIRALFRDFCQHFAYLDIDQAIDYFAFFGGVAWRGGIELFDEPDEVLLHQIVPSIDTYADLVSPSYLLEKPYRELLIAIARSDGKLLNVFRRARMGEAVGMELIAQLEALGIVQLEASREAPLQSHPGQKLKKHLRHYRIQPKVRFCIPYYRFWFGFVEPHRDDILKGRVDRLLQEFAQHRDRCASLSFEQLSSDLLAQRFAQEDPLLSGGGFWDRHSEFDILAVTQSGRIVLGECKFKGRKVCKNELNKLREKAANSGIAVDTYALFSRSGFSNELRQTRDSHLLLFESEDFRSLLS
jgi:hypothetical protein